MKRKNTCKESELSNCIIVLLCIGLLTGSLSGCVPDVDIDECATDEGCQKTHYCLDKKCVEKLAPGSSCEEGMNNSCTTDYCDGHFCCTGGDCCNTPSDCPAFYSAESECSSNELDTDCQGQRRDPVCNNNVCSAKDVDDDSGCTGLEHACPDYFDSLSCSDDVDQSTPVCLDECTLDTNCVTGYKCSNGDCIAIVGLGAPCGPSTGACQTGLKCENEICCDENGSECCADSTACEYSLTCNTDSYSCYDTCNDFDTSRCAVENTYCLNDACIGKAELGVICQQDVQCLSNQCVESVCCDSLCDDDCHSCLNSQTGQDDGACSQKYDGSSCDGTPGNCCQGVCDNDGEITGINFHSKCRTSTQCLDSGNWGYAAINEDDWCGTPFEACQNSSSCDVRTYQTKCAAGLCTGSHEKADSCEQCSACNDEWCGSWWESCANASTCDVRTYQGKCNGETCQGTYELSASCQQCLACNSMPCGDWEYYCNNVNNCDTYRHKKSCAAESCGGPYVSEENSGTGACAGLVCDTTDQCSGNTYYEGKKCSSSEGSGACSVFYDDKGCCNDTKCGNNSDCGWCNANHTCDYAPAGQQVGSCTGDYICNGAGNCVEDCEGENQSCSIDGDCCGSLRCCDFDKCCFYCCECPSACGSGCTANVRECQMMCLGC